MSVCACVHTSAAVPRPLFLRCKCTRELQTGAVKTKHVTLASAVVCLLCVSLTHVAVQERANSSPGLQAFLEKKGDEHAFSCLYLIAGIVCLYAAFMHGPEFCSVAPAATMAPMAPSLAAAAAPHRALLAKRVKATSKVRMAEMKGNMLDEQLEGGDTNSTVADVSDASSDSHGADIDGMGKSHMATFTGPHGWVVTWLTVEGFTGRVSRANCPSVVYDAE